MIDTGTLLTHQYAERALRDVRYQDGPPTIRIDRRALYREPARPSRARRALRWTGAALGVIAATLLGLAAGGWLFLLAVAWLVAG